MLCFRNIPVAKNVMDKEGENQKISVDNFLSHSAEEFRRGESMSASLTSGTEKVCIIERGGEFQGFRRKNFVSRCRKLS